MNILAVGAHWDDIEAGCGLTMKAFKDQGHNVFCIVVCTASYAVGEHRGPAEEEAREQGKRSFRAFGAQYIETVKKENSRLTYDKDVMQEMERAVGKYGIDMVFTHWHGDVNTDHRAVWEISRTAFRRVPNLLLYQSNSYADNVSVFTPNCFYGFSEQEYDFKKQLLSAYSGEWEYRKQRWEREVFDKERFWGYLCGHDCAEGFQICRIVNPSFPGGKGLSAFTDAVAPSSTQA